MSGSWIGQATVDEVRVLPEIERRAATLFSPEDLSTEQAATTLPHEVLEAAQREGRLFVARVIPERVVGFALVRLIDGAAHLEEVDVDPDYARQGFGRALVEQAIAWAVDQQCAAMTLSTFRHVAWNAPFYATMSFAELAPSALTPGLVGLREAEARAGLDLARRILMIRHLEPTADGST